MCIVIVPVSHCKDTYYFDKINNFIKKYRKETKYMVSLCIKLTELCYLITSVCNSKLCSNRAFFDIF